MSTPQDPNDPGQNQPPQYAPPQPPAPPQGQSYQAPAAQYQQPGQYQAPGQHPGYPQPYAQQVFIAAPPTNTMSILALIFGIIIAPLGIVFGHISLSQIKKTGEGGRGLALAGLIIGYIQTGFWVLYVLFMILLFAGIAASGGFY